MAKAVFIHKDAEGRLQFHDADGKTVIVHGDKPFETSDASLAAWLDSHPSVKRATEKKDG